MQGLETPQILIARSPDLPANLTSYRGIADLRSLLHGCGGGLRWRLLWLRCSLVI